MSDQAIDLRPDDPAYGILLRMAGVVDRVEGAVARMEAARQPARNDELRNAVIMGVSAHARDITRGLNWRTALSAAGVALVLVVAAFGGGYVYRGAEPMLVGVRAGTEKCDDRADGSRLCWIPVFEKLPPATSK